LTHVQQHEITRRRPTLRLVVFHRLSLHFIAAVQTPSPWSQ